MNPVQNAIFPTNMQLDTKNQIFVVNIVNFFEKQFREAYFS